AHELPGGRVRGRVPRGAGGGAREAPPRAAPPRSGHAPLPGARRGGTASRHHRLSSGELSSSDVVCACGGPARAAPVMNRPFPHLDSSDEGRTRLLLATQNRILERIARGAELQAVLTRVMEFMDAHLSGVRTSVLLLEPGGARLRSVPAPTLPTAYTDAIDGLLVGPGMGSCG